MFARRKSVCAGVLDVVTDGLHAAMNAIAAHAAFRMELIGFDRIGGVLTRCVSDSMTVPKGISFVAHHFEVRVTRCPLSVARCPLPETDNRETGNRKQETGNGNRAIYLVSSAVAIAPFICGSTVTILTARRLALSTQMVTVSPVPSAGVTSTL